jgi:WD40 repeat protein
MFSVAFARGRVVSGGADGIVRVWDAETGIQLGQLRGHIGRVSSVAFSPDGHWIVSGGKDDNTVRVWDADALQPVGLPLTGHTAAVTSVAFSPHGDRIASGSQDRTVRLWPMPDQSRWTEILCSKLTTNIHHDQQWKEWVSPEVPYQGDVCPGLPESKRGS